MTRLSRYSTSLGISHNPTSNYLPTSSSYLKNHGYFSTPKPYNRLAGEETTATNTLDKSGETAEKVRRKESDLDEDKTISHNAIKSKDIASLDIIKHFTKADHRSFLILGEIISFIQPNSSTHHQFLKEIKLVQSNSLGAPQHLCIFEHVTI